MDEYCPFCLDEKKLLSNEYAYVREDRYPVSPGHLLIIPHRHVSDFFDLSVQERSAMLDLLDEVKARLDETYCPDAYNIGVNCGQAAGQTVMHVHMHLIPRYTGDIEDPRGGVRGVIPEKQKY